MKANHSKLSFAKTINNYGDNAFLGMTDCEHYGITYGCDPECPVFASGNCEIQNENKVIFNNRES